MKYCKKGFTLIELVIVISVMGILAAIAVAMYIGLTNDAKISATKGTLGGIRSAVMAQYARSGSGSYPVIIGADLFADGNIPQNRITMSKVIDYVADTVNGTATSLDGWWYVTDGSNAGQVGAYVDGNVVKDSSSW